MYHTNPIPSPPLPLRLHIWNSLQLQMNFLPPQTLRCRSKTSCSLVAIYIWRERRTKQLPGSFDETVMTLGQTSKRDVVIFPVCVRACVRVFLGLSEQLQTKETSGVKLQASAGKKPNFQTFTEGENSTKCQSSYQSIKPGLAFIWW